MPPPRGRASAAEAAVSEIACANIESAGYELGRKLGEGRFSEVVLGKHRASGKEFAIKVVDQAALEEDEEASAALSIEVGVLKRAAKHPHVVALRAVIRTPTATYLVMDLMRGGELFDAIINRGSFPEVEARSLMKQVLSALAYCHALGVVHRDLKPENVLFEDPEAVDGTGSLKLIDFGYAALHRPGERLRGLSGTPDYVAPEVLSWYEGDGTSENEAEPARIEYDASCDMWSVGVIMFILLCGFPPFYAEGEAELIARVREGNFEFTAPYWDDISEEAKDLIAQCLSLQPEDRPTPTEALRHPWVAGEVADMEAEAQAPASAPPRSHSRSPGPAAGRPPPAKAQSPPAPIHAPPAVDDDDVEAASPPSVVQVRSAQLHQQPQLPARSQSPLLPTAAPPAPEDLGAGPPPGELIARIRQLRHAYAPGHPQQRRSGAPGAPSLQCSLGATEPVVGSAPTREELQAQGATFVKVPRSLFQDIYALMDAQRRGELPKEVELPDMLTALTAEVQRGRVGRREGE